MITPLLQGPHLQVPRTLAVGSAGAEVHPEGTGGQLHPGRPCSPRTAIACCPNVLNCRCPPSCPHLNYLSLEPLWKTESTESCF